MPATKLVLLPNFIAGIEKDLLPPAVQKVVLSLEGLFAESDREAKRYLRHFLPREKVDILPIALLNEHTRDLPSLLALMEGKTWGLISDAGLPVIADPGSKLVYLAKEVGVTIQALLGPSAIILALLLSGLEGQRFSFHGYLPKEDKALIARIHELEKRSKEDKATQIWIEAPYRSKKMQELLLQHLKSHTLLCVAKNILHPEEEVITKEVRYWKQHHFSLKKEPAVFLLYSY